eukprot:Gb_29067 [translate_table: standard]
MEVKVLKVSSVKPARPTANYRMFLSSLDILWRNVSIERIFFYRTSAQDLPNIVERLKSSLSSALVHFYPLAGRLVSGENDKRPEIECNDAGVQFIEASIDIPFQDLEADYFQHRSFFIKLVHKHDHNSTMVDSPLLSIQVTGFLGGGISVGCTMHHALADGVSFWYFMTSWAECSRGLPISRIPEHNRAIFKRDNSHKSRIIELIYDADKQSFIKVTKDADHNYQDKSAEMPAQNQNTNTDIKNFNNPDNKATKMNLRDDAEVTYRTFYLSQKMIETLKTRAVEKGKGPYSSFVVVAAHFWRCMVKAREIAEQENVNFCFLASSRNQVRPPLPSHWFGNCLQFSRAHTTARELLSTEFSFAATLIQNAVNTCKGNNLENIIDRLQYRGGNIDITTFDNRNFINVISSPKFPVYETDYGWGKPVKVQAVSIQIGAMVIFPGRDGGRSVEVSTRLPLSEMDVLHSLLFTLPESC